MYSDRKQRVYLLIFQMYSIIIHYFQIKMFSNDIITKIDYTLTLYLFYY